MLKAPVKIIHSNPQVAQSIFGSLTNAGYPTECSTETAQLQSDINNHKYALLIVDENAQWNKSESIFESLKRNILPMPIILLSHETSIQRAVEAIKMGASDYLSMPADNDLMLASVAKALSRENGTVVRNNSSSESQRPMIAQAECMQQLLSVAQRVSDSSATVLIQGESGTGKEVLARHIHFNSSRRDQPFVAMNCAALPENLIESELFGYQKGAFTGAVRGRPGKFEQAEKGTLLLDEISEMPLPMQAKLLRVLQEKEVDPLGGQKPIRVDVRCIATSNQDLARMVKKRRFREDLYFRLRVIPMTIPPLRERKEDIPLLITHFVEKLSPAGKTNLHQFDEAALDYMCNWKWPGNVRELENTVERALLISDGDTIGKASLLMDHDLTGDSQEKVGKFVGMTVKELEKKLIGQTLSHLNHNRTHAAKMLGISIRTLRNKLHEYQEKESVVKSAGNHGKNDQPQ